jgi:hypothetical protein
MEEVLHDIGDLLLRIFPEHSLQLVGKLLIDDTVDDLLNLNYLWLPLNSIEPQRHDHASILEHLSVTFLELESVYEPCLDHHVVCCVRIH